MKEFTTLDGPIHITGRGQLHIVANQTAKREDDIIRELVGSTVLLDGDEREVIGMESWLVPNKVIKAGEPIAVLFKPTLHPLTS